MLKLVYLLAFCFVFSNSNAQTAGLEQCDIIWNSQSKNSAESMPCGGGDIGLNVWVEKGDVYFYIARSGTFDENNALLKLGRVRLRLSPNPFEGEDFKQELVLKDGLVKIDGKNNSLSATVIIWVDVFSPEMHIDIKSNLPINAEASYESWRYKDRVNIGKANNANSYKWAPQGDVMTGKDEIGYKHLGIQFYHHNKTKTVFDVTVKQQGMESVKSRLFNPIKDLTFGGWMEGTNMTPAGKYSGTYINTDFEGWRLKSTSASNNHSIQIYLHTRQVKSGADWQTGLEQFISHSKQLPETERMGFTSTAHKATINWWRKMWNKSFVYINPGEKNDQSAEWQAGRNYQLFRFMLACNAFGDYPTKFNGGLFTYDPSLTDTSLKFTPDFRNWGGGTHTAQNQRLVYYPMVKNGDFDMMNSQLNYYLRCLRNAEIRSEVYWGHKGACFTEQLENFGLPNPAEYGWNRPDSFDKGVEYNKWLEYEWDTVLEFCLMMFEQDEYAEKDIRGYIPFIESCLTFFNEHYRYLAKQSGSNALDEDGKLILYPGSACETYKLTNNSTSTIAALQTILSKLLALPVKYVDENNRMYFTNMLQTIPPISFAVFDGNKTIAPAKNYDRINNSEVPQLYPLFPWGIYGIGKPGFDVALNTWKYDTSAIKFRSYIGWKQDNIFAARLGLVREAADLTVAKLKNSGRRFPAFWGPGYDWAPDHNWGGSGMIGLQEMLLQVDGDKVENGKVVGAKVVSDKLKSDIVKGDEVVSDKLKDDMVKGHEVVGDKSAGNKIYLFPAWPKTWNVHFKLHAPHNTTVEAILKDGKVEKLLVTPASRKKDVILNADFL